MQVQHAVVGNASSGMRMRAYRRMWAQRSVMPVGLMSSSRLSISNRMFVVRLMPNASIMCTISAVVAPMMRL